MRVALLAVALSGCLAPMQFDSLVAHASVNELAAQQYAQGRRVFVNGVVEDVTSLPGKPLRRSMRDFTVERGGLPYAKVTVADGSSVYCFMPMSTAVQLEKGSLVSLAGFLDGFFRDENGARSASLYDCSRVSP